MEIEYFVASRVYLLPTFSKVSQNKMRQNNQKLKLYIQSDTRNDLIHSVYFTLSNIIF